MSNLNKQLAELKYLYESAQHLSKAKDSYYLYLNENEKIECIRELENEIDLDKRLSICNKWKEKKGKQIANAKTLKENLKKQIETINFLLSEIKIGKEYFFERKIEDQLEIEIRALKQLKEDIINNYKFDNSELYGYSFRPQKNPIKIKTSENFEKIQQLLSTEPQLLEIVHSYEFDGCYFKWPYYKEQYIKLVKEYYIGFWEDKIEHETKMTIEEYLYTIYLIKNCKKEIYKKQIITTTKNTNMPSIKGAKELVKLVEQLQEKAADVRDFLDKKREWYDNHSDNWMDSDAAMEWDEYMAELEGFLEEIDGITIPEFE